MKQSAWVLLATFLLSAPAAFAEVTSELLFSHKAWEVNVVGWDDGSLACVAEVGDGTRSFSVWAYDDGSVGLQFYDGSWELGEGSTANLEVTIDSRAPWSLTNAELYKQSVLFTLPDDDSGIEFLAEVTLGNTLYLNAENGDSVESYSLAGSSASINALTDCMDSLRTDSNPFIGN